MITRSIYLPVIIVVGILIMRPGTKNIDALKHQNDSLKLALAQCKNTIASIRSATKILDALPLTASVASSGYPDQLRAKLVALIDYSTLNEEKLRSAHRKLNIATNEITAYRMMAHSLQDEVGIRDNEIVELADSVTLVRQDLHSLTNLREANEIERRDLLMNIEKKEHELIMLKSAYQSLERSSEAELYYEKGLSLERQAEKTKFAPSRKKQIFMQAVANYKLAHERGHPLAMGKIRTIKLQEQAPALSSANSQGDEPRTNR